MFGLSARKPWHNRHLRIAPESAFLLLGSLLCIRVVRLSVVVGWVDVLIITPGNPVFDLLEVNINPVEYDNRQRSTVSVKPMSVQLNIPAEHKLAQMLFGSL